MAKSCQSRDLRVVGQALLDQLAGHLEASADGKTTAVGFGSIEEVGTRLGLERWLSGGNMSTAGLLEFAADYCELSASYWHPGYMAHQIAPPSLPGVAADLMLAMTNNISLIYELAPAGTAVDQAVCRWLTTQAGWAPGGTATLTHGGSLGNLISLTAARSRAFPSSWRSGSTGRAVIMAPNTSHYSVHKAAAVMGIGLDGVVPLDTDPVGRIDVAKLPETIRAVKARGDEPVALVANACATATGLYDRVGEIGELCAAAGIWMHVDSAHGASVLLSPRLRERLDGLPLASSMTWDAHKMLRVSGLCTGVVLRNAADLGTMFRQDASYLFHEDAVELDMGQRTFETSKPPLGLKLLLTLAMLGEDGLRGYIEAQHDLAQALWGMVTERADFTCPYRPESNVLCFRYVPAGDQQLVIRDRLRQDGRFYLSSVNVDGVVHLRVALMSPNTTEETLASLLDTIAAIGTGA
ncbi:MAG TPA: pyridoxal-dependent decarboxylase [Streptosporangiaceae bacterium]|jgi:L-2,4-diaminobutyrate decarboxylase